MHVSNGIIQGTKTLNNITFDTGYIRRKFHISYADTGISKLESTWHGFLLCNGSGLRFRLTNPEKLEFLFTCCKELGLGLRLVGEGTWELEEEYECTELGIPSCVLEGMLIGKTRKRIYNPSVDVKRVVLMAGKTYRVSQNWLEVLSSTYDFVFCNWVSYSGITYSINGIYELQGKPIFLNGLSTVPMSPIFLKESQ